MKGINQKEVNEREGDLKKEKMNERKRFEG